MEGLPGFLLAGVALAGSPGPNTLSLAAAGAAFGARKAVGYLAGLGVGMIAVMTITASGLVGLLLAVPGATPVVTIAAALYFVWLAWRIATAPPLAEQPKTPDQVFVRVPKDLWDEMCIATARYYYTRTQHPEPAKFDAAVDAVLEATAGT